MKANTTKYSKELLNELVKRHYNVADIIRELGLRVGGGSHNLVAKRIKDYGLDTSHFKNRGWSSTGANSRKHSITSFTKNVLCLDGAKWTSHALKQKLYEFGLKQEICEKCSQGNVWNNKKLSMHLDHINGDHTDNRLENLRILCPNCHTQTDTYGSKKRG